MFHCTNNMGLPADVPDFKSALLNMDIGRCRYIKKWQILSGRYIGRPLVTPQLFFEGHPLIFNDHRESGPRFNISSKGRCFLQYSVPVTILGRYDTDHRVSTPRWSHEHLFQHQPTFPRRSPIQVLTSSTLLSFSGQPVLGNRVIYRVGYRNPVPTWHRYLWNWYVPNRIRTQIFFFFVINRKLCLSASRR